jgi:hypothetical protein
MTDIDMLKEVLEYGKNKGFNVCKWTCINDCIKVDIIGYDKTQKYIHTITWHKSDSLILYHLNKLLFNKEFARCVFGDPVSGDHGRYISGWQYHLQQAVINDNPLKYYYDYVKEK